MSYDLEFFYATSQAFRKGSVTRQLAELSRSWIRLSRNQRPLHNRFFPVLCLSPKQTDYLIATEYTKDKENIDIVGPFQVTSAHFNFSALAYLPRQFACHSCKSMFSRGPFVLSTFNVVK